MHMWVESGPGKAISSTGPAPLEPALYAIHKVVFVWVSSSAFPWGTHWMLELGHDQWVLAQLRSSREPWGHEDASGKGWLPGAHGSEIPQGGQ